MTEDNTEYKLGGACRAAIYRQPFDARSTCKDGVQNGDETGVDCGGSCPMCGGYYGCYHDCGTLADGSTMDRVCRDEGEWAMQKVTSIEECEARCDGYTYMALACPSDMSQGWRRADDDGSGEVRVQSLCLYCTHLTFPLHRSTTSPTASSARAATSWPPTRTSPSGS